MSSAEQYQLYANAATDQTGHDVILHTLDTWRDHTDQNGITRKLFFGSDNFSGTEPAWNGTRLIFGNRHPKTLVRRNKAESLTSANAREVGSFSNA